MIIPPFHLILKRYHPPSFWRTMIVVPRRTEHTTKQWKQHENDVLLHCPTNTIETTTFSRRAQQTAKETIYSLVIVTGVVALGGLCYLILHDLYSRETPLGIYKEASRLCLADLNVQEALGNPITVHTTPQAASLPLNNVRSKTFDEKGHRSMTLAFYLTGQDRSSVVGVKVQKNISNKFVYDYILVQLDRPWQRRNILQVHRNLSSSSPPTHPSSDH